MLSNKKSEEIRMVDPITGGEKGSKLARFDLIPPEFEWALAEAYGVGAKKYAERNWEKGYKWSLSLAALTRHLNAIKQGEWLDPESDQGRTPHIISVAWHAAALFTYRTRHTGTNDIHRGLDDLTYLGLPRTGQGSTTGGALPGFPSAQGLYATGEVEDLLRETRTKQNAEREKQRLEMEKWQEEARKKMKEVEQCPTRDRPTYDSYLDRLKDNGWIPMVEPNMSAETVKSLEDAIMGFLKGV